MSVVKVACPKCGQRVSGDETFYGRKVDCPICTAQILFPPAPGATSPAQSLPPGLDPVMPASRPGTHPVPPAGSGGSAPVPPAGPSPYEAGPTPGAPLPPSPAAGYPELPPRKEERRQGEADDSVEEVPSPLLGILSLVTGVLNTVTLCIGGPLLAPVAIILGHIALAKGRHSPVQPAPGHTLAMIGVVLGYTGLLFMIVILVVLLVFKDQIRSAMPVGA